VWTDSEASSLTPNRLAALCRSAREGEVDALLTLAHEMEEREPHYGSVLETRKLAITGLPLQVEPAGQDKKQKEATEAIESLLLKPCFDDLIWGLADAIGKGFSVCEIIWNKSATRWNPEQFLLRDPRWFRFHRDENWAIRLKDEQDPSYGIPLQPGKFIVHVPRGRNPGGPPVLGGAARLAAVAFMCKQYVVKDWMQFLEIFGMPMRVGKYGPSATSDERDILRRAVVNMGIDAAAIIPESMLIEFVNGSSGAGGGVDVFQKAAEWFDRQTSKAVLGQTMTTDDGSSQSQATVHNEVRLDRLKADAKAIETTLNRDLVKPFIDLNFGPPADGNYPWISFIIDEPEDLAGVSDALNKLVPLGLKVKASEVRERMGFSTPEAGDEVLVSNSNAAPQMPVEAPALNAAGQQGWVAPAPWEATLDALEDAELDDWEAVMDDPIAAIESELALALDAEDFNARLLKLAESGMPLEKLTRHLATASFKARGIGGNVR
jgi:phage gp29-like protein